MSTATPKEQVLKLKGYKSNLGMFLKLKSDYYTSVGNYANILVNNKPMDSYTEYKGYYLVPSDAVFEKIIKKSAEIEEYKLKQEYFELNIQKTIDASLVTKEWDNGEDTTITKCKLGGITGEMISLMYQPVFTEPSEEVLPTYPELDLKEIYIENLDRPEQTKVKATISGSYGNKQEDLDLSKCVHYHEIDEMLTPEFLIHKKPCTLPSKTFYNIVRNYVKTNYDPKLFRISSDYDFCFTVNKIVKVKPYQKQFTDYSRSSKGRGAVKTIDSKEVKVLNITNRVDNYKDHDCLPDLQAESLSELKEKLEDFLTNLMIELKSEVQECEHCKGLGHIVNPVNLVVKL